MFNPTYSITPYFLSCVEEITRLQTTIEKSRIKLPVLLELQKEAFDRNVHSSTAIEGNLLSLNQVAALGKNQDIKTDAKERLEVENYMRAMNWVIEQSEKKLDEKKLLKLHHFITQGLIEEKKSGQYRKVQNYVIDAKKRVVYTPPRAAKVATLTKELLGWINENEDINAIVASAIFHHQLVNIHPFTDGNGRLARAAALWILYQKKYDPFHIVALDEYFENDRDQYYLKITQVRELDYDFTYWIDYIAEGLLGTLQNTMRRIYQLSISPEKTIELSEKQEMLINYIKKNPGCNSSKIGQDLNINRARVNQLITPFVQGGVIRVEGRARATRYYLG